MSNGETCIAETITFEVREGSSTFSVAITCYIPDSGSPAFWAINDGGMEAAVGRERISDWLIWFWHTNEVGRRWWSLTNPPMRARSRPEAAA